MSEFAHRTTLKSAEHTSFEPDDLQALLHRLNNQLGIILANAELLEAKADAANAQRRAAEASDRRTARPALLERVSRASRSAFLIARPARTHSCERTANFENVSHQQLL